MKKLEIIIQPEKLEALKAILDDMVIRKDTNNFIAVLNTA